MLYIFVSQHLTTWLNGLITLDAAEKTKVYIDYITSAAKIFSLCLNNSWALGVIGWMTHDAYLDPSRTSEMELFTKIVNGF